MTTPSKRLGLHKRKFYDSALQKNSLASSKPTYTLGEKGRGWKVQHRTGRETEDGRVRKGEIKGKRGKPSKAI